jgi:hypothetical protein
MTDIDGPSLDSIVHIIQLSLSPIFLLTAMASLLGVFTTRLARISDQVKTLAETTGADSAHKGAIRLRLAYLRRRTMALDAAVILGALSGAATCGTVLTLFFGALRERAVIGLLFFLFGSAILCTIGALGSFLWEVMMASRGIRAEVELGVQRTEW